MGPFGVVRDQIGVDGGLHLVDVLVAGGWVQDGDCSSSGVLCRRATKPLEPGEWGLRTWIVRCLMPSSWEEQLVKMTVGVAAERAFVVAQYGGDPCLMRVEGGEDLVVHDVHGGDRELVGVEAVPGIAGVAIDGGLEIDLAHALEMADEEGVAGMAGVDVAFTELGLNRSSNRICSGLSSIGAHRWSSQASAASPPRFVLGWTLSTRTERICLEARHLGQKRLPVLDAQCVVDQLDAPRGEHPTGAYGGNRHFPGRRDCPSVLSQIKRGEYAGPFRRRLRCSSSRGARHCSSSRLADNKNSCAYSPRFI